jgi:hypothetical protein
MFKILLSLLQIFSVYSQYNGNVMPGGNMDANGCIMSAGYTWCESSQICLRQWETVCQDNFIDCDDCLTKQRNGYNIACPTDCNLPNNIVVDPMPPIRVCPEVMCMMYCEYGNMIDSDGCQICQCNEALPIPSIEQPPADVSNADSDCTINMPCDEYTYVCPKMTEITNCNMGGIDGYSTYRLSVVIKPDMNIKNIYAIYGDSIDEMYLPPVYQSDYKTNSNIGGINQYIINLNSDSNYDSWLTIGITDGDNSNRLSAIGINFDEWSDTQGLTINNGAVFLIDPEINIVEGNEYVIGQITVRTGTEYMAVFNIQGKTINNRIDKSWRETNIRFLLSIPETTQESISNDCITWYDGCNTCMVNNGVIGSCTRLMCFTTDNPRCTRYSGH